MLACPFLDISTAALVLLGAGVGHTVLIMFGMNLLFGLPLHRKVLRVFRKLQPVLVLPAPVLFWFALSLGQGLELKPFPGTVCCSFMWVYTGLCWLLGFGLFPLCTVK